MLTRIDGHAIWVNTRAMKIAEVDGRGRVPGGEIVKVRGRPSGIFVDNAMALIGRHVPTLTGAQLEQALLLAQDECIRAGLTQVQDMGMPLETIAAMKKLDADGRLKLRVYVMHDWTEPDSDLTLEEAPILPPPGSPSRLTSEASSSWSTAPSAPAAPPCSPPTPTTAGTR